MARWRKPTTSVKAILVRDFNWRIGGLRRILACSYALTGPRRLEMYMIVAREIDIECTMHKMRMYALDNNFGSFIAKSQTIQRAVREAEHNKALVAQKNASCKP